MQGKGAGAENRRIGLITPQPSSEEQLSDQEFWNRQAQKVVVDLPKMRVEIPGRGTFQLEGEAFTDTTKHGWQLEGARMNILRKLNPGDIVGMTILGKELSVGRTEWPSRILLRAATEITTHEKISPASSVSELLGLKHGDQAHLLLIDNQRIELIRVE